MKISFLDFWPGFDSKNNFFYHSINQLGTKVKVVNPRRADIIFFSCFGSENLKYNNCKKILFLGENLDLSSYKFDYSISHHLMKESKENHFRLPLWKTYIDWFDVKTYTNPEYLIPLNYIDQRNEFNLINKNKFCSIVYSSEYESRNKYINLISKYKKVDVYGKNKFNNFLHEGERNKMVHLSSYKFSLAMENQISDGYITEKLLHAKISGNIPIFYGDAAVNEDFNPNCFIYINDINDTELMGRIEELDKDKSLYSSKFDEPLFTTKPNINNFLNYLSKIIKVN